MLSTLLTSGRSFELALHALSITPIETNRLASLDKFLKDNISFLTNPTAFDKQDGQKLPATSDLQVRGQTVKLEKDLKQTAEEISDLVDVNIEEVARIIANVVKREGSNLGPKSFKTKSVEQNNDNSSEKEEKNSVIISEISKERKVVFQLLKFLLLNESIPIIKDSFSSKLKENSTFFNKSLELLTNLINKNICKSYPQDYSELIKSGISDTIIEILKLLSTLLISLNITAAEITNWFTFLKNLNLAQLSDLIPSPVFKEVQALISINSLWLLGLKTNSDSFDIKVSGDISSLQSVNDLLSNTNDITGTISYAWAIVVNDLEDSVSEKAFGAQSGDIAKKFIIEAAKLNVFHEIETFNEILNYDGIYSAILSSFLIAAVPFIQLTDSISNTYFKVLSTAPNSFIEKFFTNENTQRLLYLSRVKFPEVFTPYLRILSINGSYANNELSSMSTYMKTFKSNEIIYEYDNINDLIQIKDGLYVNPPFEPNTNVSFYLQPNTKGKIVPTSDSSVEAIIFNYNYNGWCLIGRVLQNVSLVPEQKDLLITLLDLLTNTFSSLENSEIASILQDLSTFIDDGDIIDVILKTFEQSLHQRNTIVLSRISYLLIALLQHFPEIVWPHLMRSDLLEHSGRGGLIGVILGGVETVNGNYDFTLSILKLYQQLVFNSLNDSQELLPQKAEVLPKLTNYSIQVFESFLFWQYNEPHHKYQIGTLIIEIFSKILNSIYGIDLTTPPSEKITKILAASAERIIKSFMVSLPDVRIIKPILSLIDDLSASPNFETIAKTGFWFEKSSKLTLEFSKLLISIRSSINYLPSTLEKEFFVNSNKLITTYSQTIGLRSQVLQLLTQLVMAKWQTDSPSLLSHLGDYHTGVLLSSISVDLETEYDDFEVKKYLYDFFSATIEGNQKGLSMVFLNGRDIRSTGDAKLGNEKTFLSILKQNVTNLDYYPESLSIHLVDAIAYALNSWSSRKEQDDGVFIQTLVKKLIDFKPTGSNETDNNLIIQNCYKYKLNSRIAEICALLIFTSKNNTNIKPIIDMLTGSKVLESIKPLYEPFGYRTSLHANLNKNFQSKWPAMKLSQFVRAPLASPNKYGEGAVYDLELLDEMLQDNPFWKGNEHNGGYRAEVISASVNFQYVSSQISAAKSWGALLTAYVKKFPSQDSFIEIIKKLLQANINEGVKIPLFFEIYRVRIELSFFLLYAFKEQKKLPTNDTKDILNLALDLIISKDVDFILNLSENKSEIYRPLLRIILSCLSSTKGESGLFEELSAKFTKFFEIVISKGTTVLLETVQSGINNEIGGRVEDLYLIISLFKAMISMNLPTSFISKISTMLVDYGTIKSLLNVYSSAHLLKVNNEPIFADLVLTFIIEAVSEDLIAEQFISNGLFSILIQSPISLVIQEGNIFVQTSPRYHNIWSNGLLVVILKLLSKFGSRLLPEICVFVSYFTKQFTSTINSWSQDSIAITSQALQETEQILLLQKALKLFYSEFGLLSTKISEQSIEIVPGLDSNQDEKNSLSNSLTHLLAHPKFLTSRVIPTSLEEQKAFEGEDKTRTVLVEQLVAQINNLKQYLDEN